VRGRVKLLPNGPPVPYPVQFRVVGPDPLVLRERADEVKAIMRQSPNMRGVNDNWNESVKVLRLEVDQDKARALGVTSQSIAQATRTILAGTTVGQYREGDKLIDIVLRQPLDERNAITDIGNAYLPTASGKSIPLTQIAKPVFTWEPGVMWREGRDYAITVQGDVSKAAGRHRHDRTAAEAARHWRRNGPPGQGYRIEVAGAVEESSKGSASIAAGIPIMLFITFTLLMLQLHSFSRAMLVFLTGPLGIAGVAAALLAAEPALRLCRPAGGDRADGHDPAQLGDPDRPDRAGPRPGRAGLGCHRRVGGAALRPIVLTAAAAVLAMIPAVAQRVLGADGGGHHGRIDRGHGTDAAGPAGHVRGLVPGASAKVVGPWVLGAETGFQDRSRLK
jgi:multidrug efflux pump subunit AcrB